MSFSSNPPQSLNLTLRKQILTVNLHISTLQFIATLLLTLMLLWHINTITLIENYEMPDWWVKDFLAEHANGWRVGVWVVVGLLVPVDCMHALLCLDYWCAVLHGRRSPERELAKSDGDNQIKTGFEQEKEICGSEHEQAGIQHREHYAHHTRISSASRSLPRASTTVNARAFSEPTAPVYAYHPLLHPRLSPSTQIALLSIVDILMIAILAGHIITYFVSLPTAIAFCSLPAVFSHPDQQFGEEKVLLSVRDRCIGLNVDIHVAGGFAVFMAIVLGLLHLAALVVRIWGWFRLGGQGVVGKTCADESQNARVRDEDDQNSTAASTICPPSQSSLIACSKSTAHTVTTYSTAEPSNATSISAEEHGTDVRFMDWSTERTEQLATRCTVQTDESEASKGGAKWGEMLLECLIDA